MHSISIADAKVEHVVNQRNGGQRELRPVRGEIGECHGYRVLAIAASCSSLSTAAIGVDESGQVST